jgi:transposase
MDVVQISLVTDLSTITIYKTLKKWREYGISGLIRQRGQGRKPRLDINNTNHVDLVERKAAQNPQKIEELIPSIIEELGVQPFSKWTLKRFLKSLTIAGNDSEDG